jgi:DNA-binding transcriptional regulator YiaG
LEEDVLAAHLSRKMTKGHIRAIRKRAGLSRDKFSKLLGVHLMTVAKWEWGITKPEKAAETLLRLVESNPVVLKLLQDQSAER